MSMNSSRLPSVIAKNNFLLGPSVSAPAARHRSSAAINSDLWLIVFTAGGLCWLCVAAIAILWFLPVSGTLQNGEYVVSSGARLLHHVLLFLLAALAYRIGIGLGWPAAAWPRVRVVVVNVILALLVVRVTPMVLLISSNLVDASDNFNYGMWVWRPFHATAMQWMLLFRLWLPAYVLGLVAVALVTTSRRSHRDSIRLAELSAQLADARLATLSAQLHPHFLFNGLHAISGLVTESPTQALEMVARLGDFLRIAIDSTKRPWTSVEAELMGIEAYLAVQRSRFRDRLLVRVKVEPESLSALIPALLLQPLVENAIEHGLEHPDETLEVAVAIVRHQDRLIVMVTNSTPGLAAPLAPASFGNGLRNVSARLEAAYNGGARFSIGPDPVRGTRAELNMPIAMNEDGNVKECSN
jgi:two-component system sensor histidine kinase AlgZ